VIGTKGSSIGLTGEPGVSGESCLPATLPRLAENDAESVARGSGLDRPASFRRPAILNAMEPFRRGSNLIRLAGFDDAGNVQCSAAQMG